MKRGAATVRRTCWRSSADALSATQRDSVDFLIAFGGSRQTGWPGVKYMDKACLLQDAADQTFGNDTCYVYTDSTANMGSQGALEHFLQTISQSSYAKKHLVFWNHGGAYDGVCYDSNMNSDRLTLSELKNAFANVTAVHFDIIGMDACLMANLESAEAIRSAADYLVASEELEPGHGWDYEGVLTAVGRNDAKDSEQIGTEMVKSFLTSDKHAQTKDKTLSVIDLSKVSGVNTRLESLMDKIDGTTDFTALVTAFRLRCNLPFSSPLL